MLLWRPTTSRIVLRAILVPDEIDAGFVDVRPGSPVFFVRQCGHALQRSGGPATLS